MSRRKSSLSGERRCSRAGALALSALLVLSACATGAPPGVRSMAYRDLGAAPEGIQHAPARELREGNDEAVFVRLPTDFEPVRVGDAELKDAVVSLVLDMPLRVASSNSVQPGGGLAPGSGGSGLEVGQSELVRSYGGFCERRGTAGDCFSLLEDGPYLQADDKQQLALALAVGPALEGADAEVRAMLDPTRVLATVSFALTAYMALLVAPEPASGHLC